jgi:hypothetical protein
MSHRGVATFSKQGLRVAQPTNFALSTNHLPGRRAQSYLQLPTGPGKFQSNETELLRVN